MNARVPNAPGARCASRYAPRETPPPTRIAASQVPWSSGEAERGGEVQDEEEAQQPVRAAADLEQLLLGRGNGGHAPVIGRTATTLRAARSLACQAIRTPCREEPSMSDVTTIEADVPERYADAVPTRLRRAADEDVVGRIWRKDGTLWAPEGTPEVTNRLGWLDIAEREREQLGELRAPSPRACAPRATRDAVVLGHGRLEPRARGLPPVLRQARRRADAARPGLDAPAAGPRGAQQHRPRPRAR